MGILKKLVSSARGCPVRGNRWLCIAIKSLLQIPVRSTSKLLAIYALWICSQIIVLNLLLLCTLSSHVIHRVFQKGNHDTDPDYV